MRHMEQIRRHRDSVQNWQDGRERRRTFENELLLGSHFNVQFLDRDRHIDLSWWYAWLVINLCEAVCRVCHCYRVESGYLSSK
jgi:hypothetical protein